MASVVNNDLTRGLRGRVGKFIVFRTFGGKTIASHAPRKPDPSKQSAAQRQTRSHFREAAAWAVQTLKDSQRREYYFNIAKAEGLPNAYTAALRAYMRGVGKNENRSKNHAVPIVAAVQDRNPAETSTHIHSGADRSNRVRIQNQPDRHQEQPIRPAYPKHIDLTHHRLPLTWHPYRARLSGESLATNMLSRRDKKNASPSCRDRMWIQGYPAQNPLITLKNTLKGWPFFLRLSLRFRRLLRESLGIHDLSRITRKNTWKREWSY